MTPLLVQLFFMFFVLPRYGLRLPAFTVGVIALGLHYGAYNSEVYRAGIDAIGKGQWEASIALNFSPLDTWRRIILPQAIPPMYPALGNYFVAMFKESALLVCNYSYRVNANSNSYWYEHVPFCGTDHNGWCFLLFN